jgi:hypothetical protein
MQGRSEKTSRYHLASTRKKRILACSVSGAPGRISHKNVFSCMLGRPEPVKLQTHALQPGTRSLGIERMGLSPSLHWKYYNQSCGNMQVKFSGMSDLVSWRSDRFINIIEGVKHLL